MSKTRKECPFRSPGPSKVYTRKPKNQCEAETGLTRRVRVFHGSKGSHQGKPAWAHGISPFQTRIYDRDGCLIALRDPVLNNDGMDRDQIAAEIGKTTKARKRNRGTK